MASLKREHQEFIVRCLAVERMTPLQVVNAVKDEFGVDVTRQAVRHYNPEQSIQCADEWKELFYELRKKEAEDVKSVPISSLAYRVRVYQRLVDRELGKQRPNDVAILNITKQAAQDCGGLFKAKADGATPPPMAPSVLDAIMKVYGAAVTPAGEILTAVPDAPAGDAK